MYEMVALKKLKLLDRNPRTITKPQMQKLIESINNDPKYLEANLIKVNVVDGVYLVYAGNQRVRALRKLKWKEAPCHVEYDLSEKQMQQRMLKDNIHVGRFDMDMLANEYEVEDMLDAGMTEAELQLDVPDVQLEDDDEDDEPDEKVKYCPHCNGII